jgi:hypothetical protein
VFQQSIARCVGHITAPQLELDREQLAQVSMDTGPQAASVGNNRIADGTLENVPHLDRSQSHLT